MSIGYGNEVVQSGLVYYMDFANPKCVINNTLRGMGGTTDASYFNNTGALVYDSVNGELYRGAVNNGADHYRSVDQFLLPANFTMHALVKITDTHDNTANGIITNHSHVGDTGAGITIKHVSTTDFRISCNTGSGSSRTFHSYYGATNIYNQWAFLTLRFIGSSFTLWVNDYVDYTGSYAQVNALDYIDIFNWSTTYNTNSSYRPKCQMSMASVYSRALTDEEIKRNFKAYRGRYSL